MAGNWTEQLAYNDSNDRVPLFESDDDRKKRLGRLRARDESVKRQTIVYWCGLYATQYALELADTIGDATVKGSWEWLRELGEMTINLEQKQRIDELVASRDYSWNEAVVKAIQNQRDKQEPTSVHGLDRDLYRKARSMAVRQNKNIVEWLNEAIQEKLARD